MASVITPKEGEKVLLTLRKNPNKFSKEIAKGLLLVILAVLGFLFFSNNIIITIAIVILALAFVYGLYYFILWFYDVYIITNMRIICVNQKSLFSREFIETDIEKIQDVTYAMKGVFATLFKYGTVTVRTSTGLNIELTDLSDPDEVQEMIRNLAEVVHKKQKKEMSAQELIDFITQSHKK
jgi:membrane protein YdbS with pleckstrin-like domain